MDLCGLCTANPFSPINPITVLIIPTHSQGRISHSLLRTHKDNCLHGIRRNRQLYLFTNFIGSMSVAVSEKMRKWFSGAVMAAGLKLKQASPDLWVLALLSSMMKKVLSAAFTCIFALGL